MANGLDITGLGSSIDQVNNTKVPGDYQLKGVKVNSSELGTAVNSAQNASTSAGDKCDSKVEPLYATPVDQWVTGSGFTIKEKNPPQTPKGSPNDRPKQGAPSGPGTYFRGVNCETGVGVANLNLSFNCNFVSAINIDSCLFKFQKAIDVRTYRLVRYAWFKAASLMPILDHIRNFVESICRVLKQVMKIICFIKEMIACILSTITAITAIITWIVTLPARFIGYLIECISSFLSSIMNSLKDMASSLGSAFGGILNCSGFTCPNTANSSTVMS
jgi:hypothetical protein